jgi:hypothetical protein
MYCAAAVRKAAKPITTRLTLQDRPPGDTRVSMLAEISDHMKAIARGASGKSAFILPFYDLHFVSD